ncbi:MAG: hypothetical protein IT376_03455 [Polyangiaceae bacterium]|nr:hypothetical protein [Polyangiaceae bacterium]
MAGAEVIQCRGCGAWVDRSARFCVECGAQMPREEGPPKTSRGQGLGATQAAAPDAKKSRRGEATISGMPRSQPPPAEPKPGQRAARALGATVLVEPAAAPVTPTREPALPQADALSPTGSAPVAPVGIQQTAPTAMATPAAVARARVDLVAPEPAPYTARAGAAMAAAGALPAVDTVASGGDAPPFSQLLNDLDTGFDAILTQGGGAPAAGGVPAPEAAELFQQITGLHARPLRDFMIELRLGDPPKEWLDVCGPATGSLRKNAEQFGLQELAAALGGFAAALAQADATEGTVVTGAAREALESAWAELVRVAPAAFEVKDESDRREPIIVQSLLRQVAGVGRVTLDRLHAAGISALSMYWAARADELAAAAGIAPEVAAAIVARFTRYRDELASVTPTADRAPEYAQLGELVSTLGTQTQAYEQATGWSGRPDGDRRRLRREREETLQAIQVVLARLGELELVRGLERLPFHRKVEELSSFLARARASTEAARS